MGLFSKLFGSAGSDKADKMRQMAIDAFSSIQSPELADLKVQLDKYVSAGRLTPEQAEAELLQSNAFNDIVTDPALAGAQKQALAALQDVGTSGGMTAIDKARLQDITNEQNQVAKGRNESIMQQAQQRGMGGSDINTVNQLLSEQGAADRASQRGTDVAAEAQARALQALIAGGQTAGQIRGQEYGEQANKAQAENAIDLFNKQTLNQTNLYNVDAANRAQAANLANDQSIANANTSTTNAERTQNAGAVQQAFNNEMAKATGKAGTYNAWAGDATAQKRSETAADQALLGGAIGAGMTAFGGPAGAVAGGAVAGEMSAPDNYNPNIAPNQYARMGYAEGGEVMLEDEDERILTTEEASTPFNCGGSVARKDFRDGGPVPGRAKVPGDSPANDTVKARLSPGEVVVPRTVMSDAEEFDAFMERFRPSAELKMAKGGEVPTKAGEVPTKAGEAPAKAGVSSPTRTNTETGGSSPGGASTGGVGSGIGGAGTGGAATGGASTGGAGTVNVTISGNSSTKTSTDSKKSGKKDAKSTSGDGGNDRKSPININISNVGGTTDAGNVASGDGPGASGKGGSGEGSGGGGGGGAEPDKPSGDDDEFDSFMGQMEPSKAAPKSTADIPPEKRALKNLQKRPER